jgi:hypothetical protein
VNARPHDPLSSVYLQSCDNLAQWSNDQDLISTTLGFPSTSNETSKLRSTPNVSCSRYQNQMCFEWLVPLSNERWLPHNLEVGRGRWLKLQHWQWVCDWKLGLESIWWSDIMQSALKFNERVCARRERTSLICVENCWTLQVTDWLRWSANDRERFPEKYWSRKSLSEYLTRWILNISSTLSIWEACGELVI